MIPQYDLPSKSQMSSELEEKSQKLKNLNEKINELGRFEEYPEITGLLTDCENFLVDPENIHFADVYSNKIDRLINSLSQPMRDKINQLDFLMKLVEKYCDQSEVNSINAVLTIHLKKIQNELDLHVINKDEIAKKIIETDQVFFSRQKIILGKMLEYLQNKEVICNYEKYKLELIEIIENNDKNNKQKNANENYKNIEFLEASITEFDASYQEFQNRLAWINFYDENFQNMKLIVTNKTDEEKSEIKDLNEEKELEIKKLIEKKELEIKNLIDNLRSFNPRKKSFDVLDNELTFLGYRLNDLYKNNLICPIKISNFHLTDHATNKLKLSTSKCAELKCKKINVINTQLDALINNVVNLDDDASIAKINIDISKLQGTITASKNILSEYRGISWLRCFATFFGRGQVTSELLVNKLEQQLTDLQSNIKGQPAAPINTC